MAWIVGFSGFWRGFLFAWPASFFAVCCAGFGALFGWYGADKFADVDLLSAMGAVHLFGSVEGGVEFIFLALAAGIINEIAEHFFFGASDDAVGLSDFFPSGERAIGILAEAHVAVGDLDGVAVHESKVNPTVRLCNNKMRKGENIFANVDFTLPENTEVAPDRLEYAAGDERTDSIWKTTSNRNSPTDRNSN